MPPHSGEDGPDSWFGSVAGFVADRITLIRYESKTVGRRVLRAIILIAAAALAAACAWCLLLVGAVGVLTALTGWEWYWAALILAGLHLLAAICLLKIARSPSPPPSFPHTRSEFAKDRVWLQSLIHRRK